MPKLVISSLTALRTLELGEGAVSIGRTEDCTLAFPTDELVSCRHAQILHDSDGYRIVDCASRNGTWVNNVRITQHRLRDGDLIRVGATLLRFVDPPAAIGRRCARCHGALDPDARFCPACGAAVPRTSGEVDIPATRLMPTPPVAGMPVSASPPAGGGPVQIAQTGHASPVPAHAAIAPPAPSPLAAPGRPSPLAAAAAIVPPAPSAPPGRKTRRGRTAFLSLIGLLVAGVVLVLVFFRPAEQPPLRGVGAFPTTAATATATTAGMKSRVVDLNAGGRTEIEGVEVVIPPHLGTSVGEVAVQRVTSAADEVPGGEAITDTYDIRLRVASGEVSRLAQEAVVALPVRAAFDASRLSSALIIVRSRQSKEAPWRIENAMPEYDARRRRIVFSTSHFTSFEAATDRIAEPASRTMEAAGKEYGIEVGEFRIRYYLPPSSDAVPRNWTPLFGHTDATAPAYILDLGTMLTRARNNLLQQRDSAGNQLFDGANPAPPLRVFVRNTGPDDAGLSPIGGPLVISNAQIKHSAGDMAGVVAHELVHVLQNRFYGDDWGIISGRWNRWFVEATANLYAKRAFPSLLGDGYWFKEAPEYLRVSLWSNNQYSYYGVAHFLDWLETKAGRPVVADTLRSRSMSDWNVLKAQVERGSSSLADLFLEYCRALLAGEFATAATDSQASKLTTRINMHVDKTLYGEVTVERPPTSAAAVEISAGRSGTRGQAGLLVIERGEGYDGFSDFSLNPRLRRGEEYLERPEVGANKLMRSRDGRHKAIRTFGDENSAATLNELRQVLVNGKESGDAKATYRYWLLLAPSDVRMEKDTLQWNHKSTGFKEGVVVGYNIYLGNERLNPAPVRSRLFQHPRLSSTADVTVTVVDHLGFEWPDPPSDAAAPGVMVFRSAVTPEATLGDGRKVPARQEVEITITGTTLEGRYTIRVSAPGGGTHFGERLFKGTFDPQTGRVRGTITGKERVYWGGKSTWAFTHAGEFVGALKGDEIEIDFESHPKNSPSVSRTLRGSVRARRVSAGQPAPAQPSSPGQPPPVQPSQAQP